MLRLQNVKQENRRMSLVNLETENVATQVLWLLKGQQLCVYDPIV